MPTDRAVTRANVAIILAWTLCACAILPSGGHFLFDEAYFYEQSIRFAEQRVFPAYGPFISSVDPRAMTPGGLLYVVYSVPFWFVTATEWGVVWIILLGAVGSLLLDRALKMLGAAPVFRLFAVTLATASIWHSRHSDRIWNVNLFYLLTPAMLYLTARLITGRGHPRVLIAVLGLVSAVAAQTHLSGVLPLGLCIGLAASRKKWELFHPLNFAIFGATVVLAYVPFLAAEFSTGWEATRLMHSARPSGRVSWIAVRRSLHAPWIYPSHATAVTDLWRSFSEGWLRAVQGVSGWCSIGLVVLGLRERFPLKWIGLSLFALLPLYFLATGRNYYDHYVAAVSPLTVLLPAGGAAALWARSRRWAGACAAFLAAYLVASALLMRAEFPQPGNLAAQRARTQSLLRYSPIHVVQHDPRAFIVWVLARRYFGVEPAFFVGGRPCHIEIAAPHEIQLEEVLNHNVVWRCP